MLEKLFIVYLESVNEYENCFEYERYDLNMYLNEKTTIVKRMIAFRDHPPKDGGRPCGACREFFMQLAYENRDMEILTDYETKKVILLKDLIPNWWGDRRYNK